MKVVLNGAPRELRDGTTVAELVEQMRPASWHGVAIAIDAEVVPRSAWDETELADGQRVELLTAIQGG